MNISVSSICIVGFGAFGKLIATQLCPYFTIVLIDPAVHHLTDDFQGRVTIGSFADVSRCDLIILAVPVSDFKFVITSLKDQLKPGSVVVDVGSVKVNPTEVMLQELPAHVEIVGTHPLFGPQSARNGIRGRKIAVCHIRGRSTSRIAAFLRRFLGLKVFFTTPRRSRQRSSSCARSHPFDCKSIDQNGTIADAADNGKLRSSGSSYRNGSLRCAQCIPCHRARKPLCLGGS